MIFQSFLEIHGRLPTRFDWQGSRMGSAEAEITPEGWYACNDVD